MFSLVKKIKKIEEGGVSKEDTNVWSSAEVKCGSGVGLCKKGSDEAIVSEMSISHSFPDSIKECVLVAKCV